MENEIIIQITSGRGPTECCWVVAQTAKTMLQEATCLNIRNEVIQRNIGPEPGTLVSVLIKLNGPGVNHFVNAWIGSILWIGQSPYRKYHKRKNWFVGVGVIDTSTFPAWTENDVTYQTLRSSGPGGQHVNKTESAVRAIHLPSRLSVTASDSRSQIQNKKLALARLQTKLAELQTSEIAKTEQTGWQQHNVLERGNPVKIFKGREFKALRQIEFVEKRM